jgi:HK97 family phage major capsid protein
MTLDEIQAKIKDNAIKATEILELENADTNAAKALINENKALEEKAEMIKALAQVPTATPDNVEVKKMSDIIIPSSSSFKNVKGFSPDSRAEKEKMGYAFGQLAKMVGRNDKKAHQWLLENGYYTKGQNETTDADGGYLVPQILAREVIFLRDQYGVMRQNARVMGMSSDNLNVPRNSASTTAYWPAENANITASQVTFTNVQILAKKLAILTQVSSELQEDSIVDIGATLAQDMAYVMAYNEDLATFLGDGTSTYGGITGVAPAIAAVNGGANAGWIYTGADVTGDWNATTLADLRKLTAAIPEYADRPGECAFYMNRAFFQQVVCNDLDALSGNGFFDLTAAPGPNPTLFGYPVIYTQVLSKDPTPAADTPLALFGNLKTGAIMGSRRDLRIQVSDQAGFISDSLYFRATERFGFNYFDLPTASVCGSVAVLVANN